MEVFWDAFEKTFFEKSFFEKSFFEKRAMTNKKIFDSYIKNLLSVMKKSKDPTDRSLYKYLATTGTKVEAGVPGRIRAMGEGPTIGWKHNVHPEKIKNMMHEARIRKHEPGWARSVILKAIAG